MQPHVARLLPVPGEKSRRARTCFRLRTPPRSRLPNLAVESLPRELTDDDSESELRIHLRFSVKHQIEYLDCVGGWVACWPNSVQQHSQGRPSAATRHQFNNPFRTSYCRLISPGRTERRIGFLFNANLACSASCSSPQTMPQPAHVGQKQAIHIVFGATLAIRKGLAFAIQFSNPRSKNPDMFSLGGCGHELTFAETLSKRSFCQAQDPFVGCIARSTVHVKITMDSLARPAQTQIY